MNQSQQLGYLNSKLILSWDCPFKLSAISLAHRISRYISPSEISTYLLFKANDRECNTESHHCTESLPQLRSVTDAVHCPQIIPVTLRSAPGLQHTPSDIPDTRRAPPAQGAGQSPPPPRRAVPPRPTYGCPSDGSRPCRHRTQTRLRPRRVGAVCTRPSATMRRWGRRRGGRARWGELPPL